jgi:hypothetical protein
MVRTIRKFEDDEVNEFSADSRAGTMERRDASLAAIFAMLILELYKVCI